MSSANLASVARAAEDGNEGDGQQLAFIGLDADLQETRVSFGQLNRQADAIARGLLARDYAPGDRVAILAANSVAGIAVMLGVMRAGLVAVPVNYKFPKALVEYIIADSGARLLFCDAAAAALAPSALARVLLDDVAQLSAFAALPWAQDEPSSQPPFASFEPHADEAAMILYTSGSTGKPKGVVLSHASQLWVVRSRLRATPLNQERALIAAPLYHMNALALVWLALASRASAVLLPAFNAAAYIRATERYGVTWLTAVPPMIAMMLQEAALLQQADLSSVRVVRMGSAPVSQSLFGQIRRLLPNAKIINAYGTTEGGPVVFGPHPDGLASPQMAVGYAHPEVELRLRAADGQLAAQGVLELKSRGLMSGYHNRPDLAAPFSADGFYVTGDVFRRDADGFYTFIGRSDDMFVSGGENIYPSQVERVLEQHPAVQQACVVPVEDAIKGYKPVAYVVLRGGAATQTGEAELKAFSLQHAAAYQHPRNIWFVEALPLASTNKIDRRALLADAAGRIAASASVTANATASARP